jgi:hypothetical protein
LKFVLNTYVLTFSLPTSGGAVFFHCENFTRGGCLTSIVGISRGVIDKFTGWLLLEAVFVVSKEKLINITMMVMRAKIETIAIFFLYLVNNVE